jgi:hypothetical protein
MTARSDQFRSTEARPRLLRRPVSRRVEARLQKAGLALIGRLRSAFPGQCADVILPTGDLLWKRTGRRF